MGDETKMWHEILQRLTAIETNTEKFGETADKATDAMHLSKSNEKAIAELKENQKWAWRTIFGIGVSVIVMIISKVIN